MRILEAGHYYTAKGPTAWSVRGWEILSRIQRPEDQTLLFIDDFHTIKDVVNEESKLEVVDFAPTPDFTVLESEVRPEAEAVIETLRLLPNGKGLKRNGEGRLFVSGVQLTMNGGAPSCVLFDAGLTKRKRDLGFAVGVNILPFFYVEQQQKLLRVIRKALPDFQLQVILFNQDGEFWNMPDT